MQLFIFIIAQILFGLPCFSADPPLAASLPLQTPSPKNATNSALYYDQRQTGKYNINVNIKDVAIISLEPENLSGNIGDSGDIYEDYYDYDTDDFTISPIFALLGSNASRPTSKPTKSPSTLTPISITTPSSPHTKPSIPSFTTPASTPAALVTSESAAAKANSSFTPQTDQHVIIMKDPSNENVLNPSFVASYPLPQTQANEIPVHVVMEPLLKPRVRPVGLHRLTARRPASLQQAVADDSKVVRIRSRNAVAATTNCHRGQVRDRNGRCHSRRSGLRRFVDLLSLLAPTQ